MNVCFPFNSASGVAFVGSRDEKSVTDCPLPVERGGGKGKGRGGGPLLV